MQQFVRVSLALSLTFSLRALAAEAVDEETVSAFSHLDNISLQVTGDGEWFEMSANCIGCLLDVRLEAWGSVDDPRDRTAIEAAVLRVEARDDRLREYAELSTYLTGVFAVDFVATLEASTGDVVEKRVSLFGARDGDGTVRWFDWKTWACSSGMAVCEVDSDGNQIVILHEEFVENDEETR